MNLGLCGTNTWCIKWCHHTVLVQVACRTTSSNEGLQRDSPSGLDRWLIRQVHDQPAFPLPLFLLLLTYIPHPCNLWLAPFTWWSWCWVSGVCVFVWLLFQDNEERGSVIGHLLASCKGPISGSPFHAGTRATTFTCLSVYLSVWTLHQIQP